MEVIWKPYGGISPYHSAVVRGQTDSFFPTLTTYFLRPLRAFLHIHLQTLPSTQRLFSPSTALLHTLKSLFPSLTTLLHIFKALLPRLIALFHTLTALFFLVTCLYPSVTAIFHPLLAH